MAHNKEMQDQANILMQERCGLGASIAYLDKIMRRLTMTRHDNELKSCIDFLMLTKQGPMNALLSVEQELKELEEQGYKPININ